MARITWSGPAIRDVERITEFIALDAPMRASLFARKIIRAVELLSQFPNIGRIIPGKDDPQYRELIFGNYRIMYHIVHNDEIEILSVYHSARQFDASSLD